MKDLEVRLATEADRIPIGRMLELCQHDLSDIWDQDLDDHGLYGYALDKYWLSLRCQAFAFLVAGKYAGFALVDDSVSLSENEHWMAQFFVMKKYRRQGVGSLAAKLVFDLVCGRWEVGQMRMNIPAQAFWRKVIGDYTYGDFVEYEMSEDGWDGFVQCFNNGSSSA